MDNPYEQCVRKEDYKLDKIKYTIWNSMLIAAVIFALFGVIILFSTGNLIQSVSIILVSAILALISYRQKDRAIIEYDYSFYDNTVKIARVSNGSRRKELVAVSSEEIKAIAPVSGGKFEKIKQTPNIKIVNLVLNNKEDCYYMLCSSGDRPVAILWEPNNKLLKAIKEVKPADVTI